MLQVYTAPTQPATHWTDTHCGKAVEMRLRPRKLIYTRCCHKRRIAKNCVVQSYYDGLYFWCAPGKGCKNPRVLAAKRTREFRNRSAGQNKRWAKAK